MDLRLRVNKGVGAVFFREFDRVTGVFVHVVVAIRSTTIREENHDLMDRLWVLREIILQWPMSNHAYRSVKLCTRLRRYGSYRNCITGAVLPSYTVPATTGIPSFP
jgi:hypothetical protein